MNEGHSAFLGLERIRALVKGSACPSPRLCRPCGPPACSPRTRASRRATSGSRRSSCEKYFRATARELGPALEGVPRPRPGARRQRRGGVLPHRARPAPLRPRERREPAARRGLARDVARAVARTSARGGTDRPRHQRRAPAHVDRPRPRGPARPLPRARLPRRAHQPRDLGPARPGDRRGAVAHPRAAAGAAGGLRPHPAARAAGAPRASRTRSSPRGEDVLSPYTLTICFARRFATYKRADLLLSDPERLLRLLTDPQRPVQLIFAGKAHPHDLAGKEIIRGSCTSRATRACAAGSCSSRTTT